MDSISGQVSVSVDGSVTKIFKMVTLLQKQEISHNFLAWS